MVRSLKLTTGKIILSGVCILLIILIGRPVVFLTYTYFADREHIKENLSGYSQDASNLNKAKVDTVIQLSPAGDSAVLQVVNLTLRNVMNDEDSYMSYANGEVFGFVMLFNQKRDKEAEQKMQYLTRRLIDIALTLKGSYYLPYRLHASQEQFHRAYPKAKEFFSLKRKYDPEMLFSNQFYKTYGQ